MPSPRRLDTKQTRSRNFFNKVFLPGLGTIYLQRFLSFEIFSMDVAKMTERYIEPLKIRTDIRQGGSVRICETWLIIIWAATGSKLAPFRDVSISSSFRSKEKQGSCNITQFLERQFPLGQVGFVLRYFKLRLHFLLRSRDWYSWLLRRLLWEKSRARSPNVTSNPLFHFFPFRVALSSCKYR